MEGRKESQRLQRNREEEEKRILEQQLAEENLRREKEEGRTRENSERTK